MPGAEVPVVAGRELVDGGAVVVEADSPPPSDEELHPLIAKEIVSDAARNREADARRIGEMRRMPARHLELSFDAATRRPCAWNERNTVRGPRFASAEGVART